MTTISHVDHIAIAVKSIDEVKSFYERALGLPISIVEEMPDRGIRIAFIQLGNTSIELIEPMHAHSEISSFLEKRGPGIHHLALNTRDIGAIEYQLKENGMRLVYEKAKTGAHGSLVNFVHPSSSKGPLIEIVQCCQEPSSNA